MLEKTFLNNTLENWGISVLIIVGALLLNKLIQILNRRVFRRLAARARSSFIDILLDSLESPVLFGVMIVAVVVALGRLELGETPNLFYEWTLEDTTGVVGVAAIYEDAELPVYGRFRADEHLANQSQRIRPEQIFVQVDALSKTVELPVGLEFDRVEIYNMQGALMLSVPAGTTVLDMSSCAKGLYVGRAIKDGFAVPFKFVL